MSDIKLFRIADSGVCELEGRSLALEKSLQTLMERNLEPLLGVRFLASEYSTGAKHKGRIDTLGIDENGCPVIIEYKRATNENVINQGLFYLDWLMDHQAEFKLLALERYGKEAAEAIEWSSPRLLCIAGDFTRYDEHAVQQINRNIELIRYRHFPDGFLILEMVNAVSVVPTPSASGAGNGKLLGAENGTHVTETGKIYKTVTAYLEQAPDDIRELYQSLEDYLLAIGEDVHKKVLKSYIAFKRLKNFACVEIKIQFDPRVLVFVKCPPTAENVVEGFTRDVSKIGHFGTGELEITIRNKEDLERAKPFLERSYQAS
jgi:predicted transport protein